MRPDQEHTFLGVGFATDSPAAPVSDRDGDADSAMHIMTTQYVMGDLMAPDSAERCIRRLSGGGFVLLGNRKEGVTCKNQ